MGEADVDDAVLSGGGVVIEEEVGVVEQDFVRLDG